MTFDDSVIEEIGVSGRHWIGEFGKPNFDLVMDVLDSASNNIRIATYSLGYQSTELEKMFEILRRKSQSGVQVQIIVNRLYDIDKHSDYARKTIDMLEKGRNFTKINFEPANEQENLHAKIFSVDGYTVIVGSANMSKSGMFSNHEVMIKIAGKEFATKINDLLDGLAKSAFMD